LAEATGADLYAPDAASAVSVANETPARRATVEQQTVGRTRRIRKAAAALRKGQMPTRVGPPSSADVVADANEIE